MQYLLPLFVWAVKTFFLIFLWQPTNHLDLEGLDGLMLALSTWNGGVIIISHDERFITSVAKEVCDHCCLIWLPLMRPIQLWVCGDGTITKFKGDVEAYKVRGRMCCEIRSLTVLEICRAWSLAISRLSHDFSRNFCTHMYSENRTWTTIKSRSKKNLDWCNILTRLEALSTNN